MSGSVIYAAKGIWIDTQRIRDMIPKGDHSDQTLLDACTAIEELVREKQRRTPAVGASCRFGFHRWSRWKTREVRDFAFTARLVEQERECTSCGKLYLRRRVFDSTVRPGH